MCFEYERLAAFRHELEGFRQELEKREALKKAEEKARAPGKPDAPEKKPEQSEPIPA